MTPSKTQFFSPPPRPKFVCGPPQKKFWTAKKNKKKTYGLLPTFLTPLKKIPLQTKYINYILTPKIMEYLHGNGDAIRFS